MDNIDPQSFLWLTNQEEAAPTRSSEVRIASSPLGHFLYSFTQPCECRIGKPLLKAIDHWREKGMKSLAEQLVTLEAIADDPSFHHINHKREEEYRKKTLTYLIYLIAGRAPEKIFSFVVDQAV